MSEPESTRRPTRQPLITKALVRTTSVCPNQTLTKVKIRNFEILIDEPPSNHGNDEGPQPLEYLMASLAGCTNVIINKIANERGFSITDLEIGVTGVLDKRGITGEANVAVPFPEVRLNIRAKTSNSPEEIEILKEELVWRCPVKVIIKASGSTIKEKWDIEYH